MALAFFAFVSILAQVSTWPVHMVRQFRIREAMEHRILLGLPSEALTTLRFSSAEFSRITQYDGGRELEFEGFVYDIVSTEHVNDDVVIKAVRDDEETRLVNGFDQLARAELSGSQGDNEDVTGAVSPWSPFHEEWRWVSLGTMPDGERCFCSTHDVVGRDNGAIDPGPPREV